VKRGEHHELPDKWDFDPEIESKLINSYNDQEFWFGLEPRSDPKDILFRPSCYITSRPDKLADLTILWLETHGFPQAPLFTGEYGKSKVETIKSLDLDIFVDDRPATFHEVNSSTKTVCYLFDTSQNSTVETEYRISNLREICHIGSDIVIHQISK
jgi:hypothetical protein